MSLQLLHRQCSQELNEVGPSLLPETTSEICNDCAEEEKPGQQPSNQVGHPPILPTRSGSFAGATAAAAPSWLLSTITDLNEKMELMAINNSEKGDTGETFAQRAESYYHKRPQILAFLQDLYRAYISLSERYVQLLSKNNRAHHTRQNSQVSTITADDCSSENNDHSHREELSDAESSLSFHQPLPPQSNGSLCGQSDFEVLIAEIVMKNVECDILLHEVDISGQGSNDKSRKIELQRCLLDVLESERLILLNENARLGYRVGALIEENGELAAESMFVKRKAGELAQCLLKMREDQRVCRLSRKIEHLQEQIHRLEKRNREYYEKLVRRDFEGEAKKGNKGKGKSDKVFGWWERVKRMDVFMCGMMQADHNC